MKKLLLLALLVLASPLHAANDTLRASGDVAKSGEWTVSQLESEFSGSLQTISYTLKDQKHTARCLSLLEFIQSRQPRVDPKVKNHQMGFVALVGAKDGYTVSFSMGELLPDFGNRKVWLALDEDGKPLLEKQGPVRLVIPDEAKPTRWIYGVTSIKVRDGRKLSK